MRSSMHALYQYDPAGLGVLSQRGCAGVRGVTGINRSTLSVCADSNCRSGDLANRRGIESYG